LSIGISVLVRLVWTFRSSSGDFVTQVIACPHCGKALALRDELKGYVLSCPQCKGRFAAPDDESVAAENELGAISAAPPSPSGSDMAFLDDLATLSGPAAERIATKTRVAMHSPDSPAASIASRLAAIRARRKSGQLMMIYVGGGIVVAVLLVVMVAMSMSSGGEERKKKSGSEVVRFGMTDSVRHQLFSKMILAVDEYGISKDCKEEWFRLADEFKLDRKNIGEVLDEGFSRNDWDQPAPAHVTSKTRGARMEWNARRANGGDPILAL